MDLSNTKTLTASRLQILQKIEAGVLAGVPEVQSFIEYLFAVTATIPELIKASKNKEAWRLAVLIFGDEIDISNITEIEAFITADFERIEAGNVQPVDDGEMSKG